MKSIISFLKLDNSSQSNKKLKKELAKLEEADETDDSDELQKELELEELRQKQILDQQRELERQEKRRQDILKQQKEQARKKEEEEKAKKEQKKETLPSKDLGIDLDWQKGKSIESEQAVVNILSGDVLYYQQNLKTLPELIGLIIDMIARKVDDLKIAQTVIYRNQGKSSEDEVMQTIMEVKNFLALAAQGKFNEIL